MPQVSKFISENWKWILTILIGAGVAYNQFQEMRNDMGVVKRRQQNYIDRFNQLQEVNHDLEIRVVRLETTECK